MKKLSRVILVCLLLFCQEAITEGDPTSTSTVSTPTSTVSTPAPTVSTPTSTVSTPTSTVSTPASTVSTPASTVSTPAPTGSEVSTPAPTGSEVSTPAPTGSEVSTPASTGSEVSTPAPTVSTPASTGCPANMTATNGSITLPLGDNIKCEWSITVPSGKRVILTFDEFNLPEPCSQNFLQLSKEDPNVYKTTLCDDERPHAQTTTTNVMKLKFQLQNKNEQTSVKATFRAGESADLIKVTVVGLVYDDGEPESWDDDLTTKNSEEWLELQEELCEAVSDALASEIQLYAAVDSCLLENVRKVRVRNYDDGEDDDENDTDDDKDDNDDSSDNDNSDKDNDGDTDDNDSDNDQDSNDDKDDSRIKVRRSVKASPIPRPPKGEYMDGIEAMVYVTFDKAVYVTGNYSQANIHHLISSQGAQNGTSSFGKNIGKIYPNGATRLGYLSWIVGLLTMASWLRLI